MLASTCETQSNQNNMKSILFSLLILLGTSQLFGQQLTKDAFLGTWKVVDSQLTPEMNMKLDDNGMKMMEQMRVGFIGTIFNFKVNGEFTIQFTKNIPELMKELEFVNNTKWKIEDGKMIAVGTEEDGYSLMGIIVGTKEGKQFFFLDESPFILEVAEQ